MMLFLVLLFGVLHSVSSYVRVVQNQSVLEEYNDVAASFGQRLGYGQYIKGHLVAVSPVTGCSFNITRPPDIPRVWIALIERGGGCLFAEKALHAQFKGYDAAIIYNNVDDEPVKMSGGDTHNVEIIVVSVGRSAGVQLRKYAGLKYLMEIISDDSYINFEAYIIPFLITVSTCFALMTIFFVVRCVRERRRINRHRLPKSVLNTLQVKKYAPEDDYDVCAICLEEYSVGDKLRILPCKHAFHCKCIDPWLTQNKKLCPLCKHKVFTSGNSTETSDDEREPLMESNRSRSPLGAAAAPSGPISLTYGTCETCPGACSHGSINTGYLASEEDDSDTSSSEDWHDRPPRVQVVDGCITIHHADIAEGDDVSSDDDEDPSRASSDEHVSHDSEHHQDGELVV